MIAAKFFPSEKVKTLIHTVCGPKGTELTIKTCSYCKSFNSFEYNTEEYPLVFLFEDALEALNSPQLPMGAQQRKLALNPALLCEENPYISFIPKNEVSQDKKFECQCGVHTLGYGKHSDWCPIYTKD